MYDLNYSSDSEQEWSDDEQPHNAGGAPSSGVHDFVQGGGEGESSGEQQEAAATPESSGKQASTDEQTGAEQASVGPSDVPGWWGPGMDERFAEVLYVHGQREGSIDHYVFTTQEARERFPDVTDRQWFVALPFLMLAWSSASSALRVHHRLLKRKRAKVAVPEAEADAQQRRRSRRQPRGGGSPAGGGLVAAWRGITTDGAGRLLGD